MDEHTPAAPIAEAPRPPEWRGIVVRTLAALVVLAAAYVGLAYWFGDRVPAGTTVQGVGIGTLSRDDAEGVLVDKLAGFTTEEVQIASPDGSVAIAPATAGLTPDYPATLSGLTGLTFDPRNLWSRITGDGRDIDLEVSVEQDAVRAAVQEVAPDLVVEPVEAEVVLTQGEVRTTLPQEGSEPDVEATVERIVDGWPGQTRVEAPMLALPSVLSAEQVQAFVTEKVEPAIARPLAVEVAGEDTRARISQNQLVRLLSVEQVGQTPGEARLRLLLDEAGLGELVRDALTEVVQAPVDASVSLADGRPQITPAVIGAEIDDAAVLAGAREVLAVDGAVPVEGAEGDAAPATAAPEAAPVVDGRIVTIETVEVEPAITDEDADAWQVDTIMAEFESPFPGGEANAARTENIRVGLTYVTGSVVMPGEQFSLAETLAPISPDRGYVDAGVIRDGRLVEGIGGGLSQVSTALLNTAWFSGVRLDSFTPHSYYISRYPVGREATISVGAIDNTWTNDTDSPVIIETSIAEGSIVMRFWGDRQLTVDTTTSPRRDVVQPETFDDDSADCLTQGEVEGFTVTVTRSLSRSGDEVRSEDYTTTYQPSPGVTCTNGGGR